MNFQEYLNHLVADYSAYMGRSHSVSEERAASMIEEFSNKLTVKVGKKYTKVIAGSSAHSFIVMEDDGKFRKGDILKPAGWSAPAKNFARGNILKGN